MVSQVRWREEHRNRVIRSVVVEDVRNVILPRRMLLIVCFFFDSLMLMETQHVGRSSFQHEVLQKNLLLIG